MQELRHSLRNIEMLLPCLSCDESVSNPKCVEMLSLCGLTSVSPEGWVCADKAQLSSHRSRHGRDGCRASRDGVTVIVNMHEIEMDEVEG